MPLRLSLMNSTDALDIIIKLVVSVVLGGLVGWQREALDRPAGFRTHVLVCMGSTVYMLVSTSFMEWPRGDPARVASNVATGIGFLGAGTIIRHGNVIRGLTTAASVWTVAGIGLAVGLGGKYYLLAVVATLLVLATLSVFRKIEESVMAKRQYRLVVLQADDPKARLSALQQALAELEVSIKGVEIVPAETGEQQELRATLRLPPKVGQEQVTGRLMAVKGITGIQWD